LRYPDSDLPNRKKEKGNHMRWLRIREAGTRIKVMQRESIALGTVGRGEGGGAGGNGFACIVKPPAELSILSRPSPTTLAPSEAEGAP